MSKDKYTYNVNLWVPKDIGIIIDNIRNRTGYSKAAIVRYFLMTAILRKEKEKNGKIKLTKKGKNLLE